MLADAMRDAPLIREAVSDYAGTAESATELGLLRRVETTVDTLCAQARFFRSHTGIGRRLLDSIQAAKPDDALDADGALDAILAQFVAVQEQRLAAMTLRKGAIDRDRRLREHHSDQLHSAYDDVLHALADSADVARDIQAALITHDLAREPRDGEVFQTVEELHRALVGP